MITSNDDAERKQRRADLLARKILQADEARVAMAEYQKEQQATLDRTAKLKAARLAQPADPPPTKPKRKTKAV
jgi:hypothetical protein